jgi:hypothetical protein
MLTDPPFGAAPNAEVVTPSSDVQQIWPCRPWLMQACKAAQAQNVAFAPPSPLGQTPTPLLPAGPPPQTAQSSPQNCCAVGSSAHGLAGPSDPAGPKTAEANAGGFTNTRHKRRSVEALSGVFVCAARVGQHQQHGSGQKKGASQRPAPSPRCAPTTQLSHAAMARLCKRVTASSADNTAPSCQQP